MSFGTVSMLTIPDQFAPVNTDGLWFQMNNPSYSQTNFSYLVDVFCSPEFQTTNQTGTVSLGSFKIPPRPYTGDGIFTPHQILKSQIVNSPLVPINITGVDVTYNSMVKYWIDFGFQLNPQIDFTTSNFFGILELDFSVPNPFNSGDIVTLQMENQKINPSYNVTASVIGVGATATLVAIAYGTTPTSTEYGTITNISRITGTTKANSRSSTGGNYAWNSIRQYEQKGQNFGTTYRIANDTQPFLTSYTQSTSQMKPSYRGTYETMGALVNGDSVTGPINNLVLTTYDVNNNPLFIGTYSFTSIGYKAKIEVGVGPQNVANTFGNNFSGVEYYKLELKQGSVTRSHILRRIDRPCDNLCYETFQIQWLNRLGSYEFWNFTRNSKQTLTTEKVEWKKQLPWDYSVGDRQQSVLSQKAVNSYVANTDWVNEYDYNFLQELITSPEVYRVEGTYSIPIVITDSQWVEKTQWDEVIFNYTINFKDAFNFMTQDS